MPLPQPVPPAAPAAASGQRPKVIRTEVPAPDEIVVRAIRQEVEGSIRRLRGKVQLETSEAKLTADEVDYNEATGMAEARGNVVYFNYSGGEELRCNRAEYDVRSETGKFYEVSGVVPLAIQARPGILTSNNPFVFEGKFAERVGDRYIIYDGFVTSCRLPKPWWTLTGRRFDVIPNDRAIAKGPLFRLRGVPLFYAPYYYKPLEKRPRQSGFLTPNFGNSTTRGLMFGVGMYWAISRNYDVMYRPQYFTERGFAHLVDFRGKPTQRSDFNFILYGVNDKGRKLPDGRRIKEGGYSINFFGKTELPGQWSGLAQINYITSFRFRQAFTETFNEAIVSEITSTAYLTKHWNGFGINGIFSRVENFQSNLDDDKISIRKLPEIEFFTQDRRITKKLPLWWSFDTSASLLRRSQPLFQTRQSMERLDAAPQLTAALKTKHVQFIPSISFRGTYWGSSFSQPYEVVGKGLFRGAYIGDATLILPSMSRIYTPKKWVGDKLKHVIEPRLTYRYVGGVNNFRETIRFDETELLNNTNEAEISVANRFFTKRGGVTREWATWEVWHRRYFDPGFGGSLVDGRRNVNWSSATFSGFAFLDRARRYSPVASNFRVEPIPGLGAAWRMDYDPLRSGVSNNTVSVDGRVRDFFVSAGHNQVRSSPLLSPPANQFRGLIGWGRENRRGWNAGFFSIYDYRLGTMQFANTQVTYNTDCCGFSLQWRRFNFGTRFENQFRVALAIANVGSFGTLRKQERYF
jgi:LPS-assembly protein